MFCNQKKKNAAKVGFTNAMEILKFGGDASNHS
jgi:hypothetical protein